MPPGAGQISTAFHAGDRPGVTCEFSQNYAGGIPPGRLCEYKNEYQNAKRAVVSKVLSSWKRWLFCEIVPFETVKHPQNGVF
nr:MAG TPA: hypothetical protein [Bacteriophage sp.]